MEQWEDEYEDDEVLSINGEYKYSLLVGEEMSENVYEKFVKAERSEAAGKSKSTVCGQFGGTI